MILTKEECPLFAGAVQLICGQRMNFTVSEYNTVLTMLRMIEAAVATANAMVVESPKDVQP